jgi:hypothetical protein
MIACAAEEEEEAEAIEEVTKIMKRTSQVLKCLFPLLM